jgi:hypothetical protein
MLCEIASDVIAFRIEKIEVLDSNEAGSLIERQSAIGGEIEVEPNYSFSEG